jgi:hypothetical protein
MSMNNTTRTILALAAIAITVGYLWQANRPDLPKPATWEDVVDEAEVGGYRLISTEELAQRYGRDPSGPLRWTPGRDGNTAPDISKAP